MYRDGDKELRGKTKVQLICVMNGGKLVQDITNHAGCSHWITNGTERYKVTSLHHQMIYPWDLDKKDYDILFWSEKNLSKYYEGDQINLSKIQIEPEVAVFHKEGMPICFGAQGHPEMMFKEDPFIEMLNIKLLEFVDLAKNKNN